MMNTLKRLLIALLCIGVLLCFVACTNTEDNTDTPDTTPADTQEDVADEPETEETEEPAAAGFKVSVVDQNGDPVVGAMVQICKDSCVPGITDADGVATIYATVDSDGYALKVANLPDGYTYEGEDVYLEVGMTESTITITKVA